MRVDFRTFEDAAPGRPIGKMVLRPETPEELTDLDAFRRAVDRHSGGDKFEIVFFPKKPRPEPEQAAAAAR